jgi:hypothetical protein
MVISLLGFKFNVASLPYVEPPEGIPNPVRTSTYLSQDAMAMPLDE